jgi:hypothetical protein
MLIAVIAERMFAQMRLTPPLFLIVRVKVHGTDSACRCWGFVPLILTTFYDKAKQHVLRNGRAPVGQSRKAPVSQLPRWAKDRKPWESSFLDAACPEAALRPAARAGPDNLLSTTFWPQSDVNQPQANLLCRRWCTLATRNTSLSASPLVCFCKGLRSSCRMSAMGNDAHMRDCAYSVREAILV